MVTFERFIMLEMRVNLDMLNLRAAPVNGTILAALPRGHAVTTAGPSGTDGWVKVGTKVNGHEVEGVVAERRLRALVSAAKESLMSAAVAEWLQFDRGSGKENEEPYFRFVGKMWDAIGLNLDGRDRDQPWSAAFISWCVRTAGYNGFKFAAAHARYIHDSIKKKLAGEESPFWGWRIGEQKAELGDMVCQWRNTPRTYDQAAAADGFFSHCDIIVEVGDGFVRALGGNNSDTVNYKRYNLTAAGNLLSERKVFAILKNRN
ncbi:DUF2272 domain-containing protein [Mesorhizobium ephedrae]|uniref:DUF2272 domain-containing protein n=1 Tax=Kumtagia ephedrae TaxID=2116701 RepID=A0A2P7S7G2_9HYPH|nr:DUF2272 domain-containing protein [Mesorhizobium ephedrae]